MSQIDRQAVILYRDHHYGPDDLGAFFQLPPKKARQLYSRARFLDLQGRLRLIDAVDAARREGAAR